ncbi:MAG: PAS domain-containing sensor histidine kinase [Thiobacillus sp. 63-78]|uniref:PAS domain-containing sensor histidine kinase n=1 Tax=Thiobacillus sp. 63-78 TaxID=1895859 RepID=UPI0008684A3B|nr:ATP-binding protein [Thiobacillus sp. 63-78]MBN8763666.1 PAS domain S-box protein [Thiobacillus sp.]ODU86443.1 MAG: PAS domain-containing sensor histidine kinase [Thiobacillus sp. SCN 65-179]MBN8765594.1 PAS domain S-box protein [Thiobacillus sp.]MBN8773108.1 PAS domain S-box protein [Thiobacillus sp.]OJZ05808.1 MAG: PAS domain-containing sensor histidine kinase [Thiobacillus sp. 63-78]
MQFLVHPPLWALLITVLILIGLVLYVGRLNLNLRHSKKVLEVEIGERRRAEENLMQNENHLRQIIATEPECVKLQTPEGILLEMNPAGLALMEAGQPDEIIGTSVYNIIAPEFRDDYRKLSTRVFAGESGVMEFQIISLKGRRRWMETHAVPLRDRCNKVIALLGITRDITARKHAEEGVRQHYRELAHASRVNTMGEMASGLAHELNQPLAAIANYSHGCLRRIRSGTGTVDDLTRAIEQVCNQADRAAEIIRSLRGFVNKADSPHQPQDIRDIVHEAILIVGPEARTHEVEINLKFMPDMPRFMGNAIQIEQVILNLIRNAVEAMSNMPPVLRRIDLRTSIEGNMAVVEVRDFGPGLPHETLARIFDPFFTTKMTGMGMGLPICRSIVEAHGGTLSAFHNEKGCGLTVRFTLRRAMEETLHE